MKTACGIAETIGLVLSWLSAALGDMDGAILMLGWAIYMHLCKKECE